MIKNFIKDKKKLIICSSIVVALILIIILFVLLFNNQNNKISKDTKEVEQKTYTMYIKINPLVKLEFKEEYKMCKDKKGKEYVCRDLSYLVTDFELINDDAKDIYKNLNFKEKDLAQVLAMLCDEARDNNIGFESLEVTSDNKNISEELIKKYIEENSKYETVYTVYVNFKEYIDEDKIVDDDTQKEFKVTFDTDGGSKIDSVNVKKNEKVSIPDNPTKEGYTFVEWQLDGKKYDFNSLVTGDITLIAKWEQNKKEDNNNNNQNTKPNTNNNTSNNNSNNSNTNENKSNIKSTMDKINLNDNILVQDLDYIGTICGYYIFADNILEVYPNSYTESGYFNISDETNFSKLNFDIAKENSARNLLESAKNSLPIGVIDFSYEIYNHKIKYLYSELILYDYKKYGSFGSAWNSQISKWEDIIHKAVSGAKSVNSGCGDGFEPTLLTQELCNKYKLNCSRW